MEPAAYRRAGDGPIQLPPPSDDLWLLVLRATRDPVSICTAARVCRHWNRAAQEPTVWAEADIGAAVRRYVSHNRCLKRDGAIAQAARGALQRLKLFRAFTTWRYATTASTEDGQQSAALQGELALEEAWAPQSSRAVRAEAGYGGNLELKQLKMVSQVSLDTDARTLGYLVKEVLVGHLGFQVPNVSCGSMEFIWGTEAQYNEESGREGAYAQQLATPLADFARYGLANGTPIDIDDDESDRTHSLIVRSCTCAEEISTPTITLRSRLAYHRARGRAMLRAAHKSHQSELVRRWPQDVPLDPEYYSIHSAPIYSSPEDAVFEQDKESQELADEALRWCSGARAARLSQVAHLDLSGLGVSVSLVALICNAARKSHSLRTLALDHCAMLDFSRDLGGKEAKLAYKELRATLVRDGVSISDRSDTLDIKVVDERGVCVHFKQRGRHRLQSLFIIYSIRQGGEWEFFYHRQDTDGKEKHVRLQASDSPRRIGMVPPLGSERGADDASSNESTLEIQIYARKLWS